MHNVQFLSQIYPSERQQPNKNYTTHQSSDNSQPIIFYQSEYQIKLSSKRHVPPPTHLYQHQVAPAPNCEVQREQYNIAATKKPTAKVSQQPGSSPMYIYMYL